MATQGKKGLLQEFREFIANGTILELAVAIVIGIAFGAAVKAFIDGILMPLVAAIAGKPNFDALILNIGEGRILYGTFLTALFNFFVVGAAMFFVVKAVARMQRGRVIDVDAPVHSEETELLMEIRDLLSKSNVRS